MPSAEKRGCCFLFFLCSFCIFFYCEASARCNSHPSNLETSFDFLHPEELNGYAHSEDGSGSRGDVEYCLTYKLRGWSWGMFIITSSKWGGPQPKNIALGQIETKRGPNRVTREIDASHLIYDGAVVSWRGAKILIWGPTPFVQFQKIDFAWRYKLGNERGVSTIFASEIHLPGIIVWETIKQQIQNEFIDWVDRSFTGYSSSDRTEALNLVLQSMVAVIVSNNDPHQTVEELSELWIQAYGDRYTISPELSRLLRSIAGGFYAGFVNAVETAIRKSRKVDAICEKMSPLERRQNESTCGWHTSAGVLR